MPDLLSVESISELGWGVELFAVVMLTLIGRYLTMRALKVLGEQFEKTSNVWDDAFFKAAQGPLSWFILILGLIWAVQISDGYLDMVLGDEYLADGGIKRFEFNFDNNMFYEKNIKI